MMLGRWPLARGSKMVLDLCHVLPPSLLRASGMRPSMLEFLPPKPSRSPFFAITMVVCRPAVRPPVSYQVLPSSLVAHTTLMEPLPSSSLPVGARAARGGPHDADGAVAVVVLAGGVGGDVDGAVLGADDAVDRLRNVAADGLGEGWEHDWRPGHAVVDRKSTRLNS